MADDKAKKKVVKKKSVKEDVKPEGPHVIQPKEIQDEGPEEESNESILARAAKRKPARAGSNVFAMFSQNQVAEFKEVFAFIDHDKDGFISRDDLAFTLERVGRMATDKEIDDMMKEASGPINFTMFLTIFGDRVSGMDEEDIIMRAFSIFDEGDGSCCEDKLKVMLCTFGEPLSEKECQDCFDEAPLNSVKKIDLRKWARVLTGGRDPEE